MQKGRRHTATGSISDARCTDGFRFAQPILRPARERIALPAQCGVAAPSGTPHPDFAALHPGYGRRRGHANEPDRRDLGRALHPPVRGPGAGDRARPLHRRSCRPRAGCASCAARWRPAASRASSRRPARCVITAADLAGVKPLRPMLHKFNYVPVGAADPRRRRRALCRRTGRGRGRCERGGSGGHRRSGRGRDRGDRRARRCEGALAQGAPARSRGGAGQRDRRRQGEDPAASTRRAAARTDRRRRGRARAARTPLPLEPRGGACRIRPRLRPRHAHLLDPDAASDAHRDRRPARHAGSRSAGHRARCRRWLRAEDVAADRIRHAGLAGPQAAHLGRLDRGSPREPDRLLPQPRPARHARRRVRRRRQAARALRRCARQYRRLFLLPDHLRRSSR